ncbi:hypothetical protein N0V86_001144 [Didymella sp. IMI 355093]|nr:hypothetical protein N0V86_001144 [Didymella sp. IMI 355093]
MGGAGCRLAATSRTVFTLALGFVFTLDSGFAFVFRGPQHLLRHLCHRLAGRRRPHHPQHDPHGPSHDPLPTRPLILANQPPCAPDPNALYRPIATSRFLTSAAAKAHRKRARLPPKAAAADLARVKAGGRDYWVCRIYNAMINSSRITDGARSVHRLRFTSRVSFEALDLEAAAHGVFDEAIAVHERGWNKPGVYHKHTVRGKLVDVSGGSVELRLSRICRVLEETKSAVDDAVRGGVTRALLCDNPEARRFTKESNNLGNRKRGERLRQTATRAGVKAKTEKEEAEEVEAAEDEVEDGEDAEGIVKGEGFENQELVDTQDVSAVQATEE